ncbi:hypothetical protein V1515DRAFT_255041 [Lipomyces mesembrius]
MAAIDICRSNRSEVDCNRQLVAVQYIRTDDQETWTRRKSSLNFRETRSFLLSLSPDGALRPLGHCYMLDTMLEVPASRAEYERLEEIFEREDAKYPEL